MKTNFFRIWMLVLFLPMSAMAEEQKPYQMQEVEVIASPVIEGTHGTHDHEHSEHRSKTHRHEH